MKGSKVKSVSYLGKIPVMDITIDSEEHLFYANGMVSSNCKAHATSYSVYSYVQMWLQEHYFIEYMCALLNHIDRSKEKKGVGVLNERVEYCIKHGISIKYPDVTASTDKWEINGSSLVASLKNIKGFSDRDVSLIVENRPYADLKDFLDKTKFNKNRFETLLFSNALSKFGTIEELYNWYYNHYFEKDKKPKKKKKDEGQFMLFDMDEPEEDSSSVQETITTFTKTDLEDRCLDLNGFVVHENVQIKYHEFFERGMEKVAELKKNEAYNSPRRKIRKLSEIEQEEVDEDKFKNRWVLAKVITEVRDIPSKYNGKTFDKIVVNDGFTSLTIMGKIPRVFKKGRVMVFPISIIGGKVHIDIWTMDKREAVILEDVDN